MPIKHFRHGVGAQVSWPTVLRGCCPPEGSLVLAAITARCLAERERLSVQAPTGVNCLRIVEAVGWQRVQGLEERWLDVRSTLSRWCAPNG